MTTITITLKPTQTHLAIETSLAEAGEALTTLGAILPGLRLAGILEPPNSPSRAGQRAEAAG